MRKLLLCAALLAAVCLAGCSSLDPDFVREDRMTKNSFAPFYQKHSTEEDDLTQRSLKAWWDGWEVRLKAAEEEVNGN